MFVWTGRKFLVCLDTNTREFQYKILNRYPVTDTFLKKIGEIDFSMRTFCSVLNESMEHLFMTCHYLTTLLWKEPMARWNGRHNKVESLSAVDNIIFGDWWRNDWFSYGKTGIIWGFWSNEHVQHIPSTTKHGWNGMVGNRPRYNGIVFDISSLIVFDYWLTRNH